MQFESDKGSEMTEKKRRGPKPHAPASTYLSVRLPISIAHALYDVAIAKGITRNKLISNALRDVVEAEKTADVSVVQE